MTTLAYYVIHCYSKAGLYPQPMNSQLFNSQKYFSPVIYPYPSSVIRDNHIRKETGAIAMAIQLSKLQASDLDNLAEKVTAYRHALGWSQQNLADEARCSRPTIARLEAGNTILSVTLIKVIEAINRGIESQGLLEEPPARKGKALGPRRGPRRRRPEGDRRSEPRRLESRDDTVRDKAPIKDDARTKGGVAATTGDVLTRDNDSEARVETHRSAHSGVHAGKTGEQLQREMFAAPSLPVFSGLDEG